MDDKIRTRRGWLRLGMALGLASTAAARAAPGARPPPRKRTKESVGYLEQSVIPNRHCGNCILYAGNGECIAHRQTPAYIQCPHNAPTCS